MNIHNSHNLFDLKMDNIFKQNSRFAVLAEDTSTAKKDKKQQKKTSEIEVIEEKFNSFKYDNRENNSFNSFKNRDRDTRFRPYDEKERQKRREQIEAQEKERKINELKEKERKNKESLNIDNFPTLGLEQKIKTNKSEISYSEKIKNIKKVDNNDNLGNNKVDNDLVNLKPGWALIKKVNNKIVIKTHPEKTEPEKTEQEIGRDILKALVDLHEKRTQEYINMYGYDTWEKMFKRPHWREEEAEIYTDSDDEEQDIEENEDELDSQNYGY